MHSYPNHMTCLTTLRRSSNICWTLFVIGLAGCAGAHAAKAHARSIGPAHESHRSQSAPRRTPAAREEVKPLVGELMA